MIHITPVIVNGIDLSLAVCRDYCMFTFQFSCASCTQWENYRDLNSLRGEGSLGFPLLTLTLNDVFFEQSSLPLVFIFVPVAFQFPYFFVSFSFTILNILSNLIVWKRHFRQAASEQRHFLPICCSSLMFSGIYIYIWSAWPFLWIILPPHHLDSWKHSCMTVSHKD